MLDYEDINKKLWNKKTTIHVDSAFYNMKAFREGKSSLNPIELDFLGDVNGQTLLHLQCHFGQDSLSLARLGGKVTGVDLSDASIAIARRLNEELGLDANFYMGNVLALDKILPLAHRYDLIFCSYGTIGWLPELESWAKHIGHFLKPGGRFIIVDFHPTLWMMDDHFDKIGYSYFNVEPIIETASGTYAEREADIHAQSYSWNHPFSEILGALLGSGALRLTRFEEFDYSPYNCFNNTVACDKGFQIKGLEGKLPMVYALALEKPHL
jgi:SAM-dependent methyltransferase